MQDLKAKLEKFLADAEDCDLIARLATDPTKRQTFRSLADNLRKMAADVEEAIHRLSSGSASDSQ